MKKQTVRDIDLKGKRVLVRVALNVPIKDNRVVDAFRIEASLPTLKYLLEQDAALLLISHHSHESTSLAPVAPVLEELLGRPVRFVTDVLSDEAKTVAAEAKPGSVVLFENLRFHPEEEANDPAFARALAALGEVYVDDDFTVMHREHASVVGLPRLLPAVAGLLVEKEVDYIGTALETPNRPLVAIIGGAKVSSKIAVLENLVPKVDVLILGGAMANTFFLAQGKAVGKSLAESDQVETAKRLMELARVEDTELIMPDEVVVSRSLEGPKDVHRAKAGEIKDDEYVVDVTPALAQKLSDAVYEFLDFDHKCTVIWNGPLGLTEVPEFAEGSLAMAGAVVGLPGETSIIGGGDTAAFIDAAGRHDQFTWVSTGGGASLELMAGKRLPGIEALLDK
jgi:phosphoglycerate kinase